MTTVKGPGGGIEARALWKFNLSSAMPFLLQFEVRPDTCSGWGNVNESSGSTLYLTNSQKKHELVFNVKFQEKFGDYPAQAGAGRKL